MRVVVAFIGTVFCGIPALAAPAWMTAETAHLERLQGPFVQPDFGYSVTPPPNVPAYVTRGGDGNHGVELILGEERTIIVDAEYTEPDWANDKPCVGTVVSSEAGSVSVKDKGRVGGHPACALVIMRGCKVWRVMQVAGDDGHGQGIMFTFLLTTQRDDLQRDQAVFQKVADSFRRVPISP